MSAKTRKRRRASRRRTFWAWKSHLEDGTAAYLFSRPRGPKALLVRVRLTILPS